MKDVIPILAEFANDLIGSVVPGAIFLGLMWLLFHWPLPALERLEPSLGVIVMWTVASYACGHALSAVVEAIEPLTIKLGLAPDKGALERDLEKRKVLQSLKEKLALRPDVIVTIDELRSKLMTVSPTAKVLAVRFMHISLLCGGVSVALITVALARVYAFTYSPALLRIHPPSLDIVTQTLAMIVIGIVLLWRGKVFGVRSFLIPFTISTEDMDIRASQQPKQGEAAAEAP